MTKKRVVIVGGGFAGLRAYRELSGCFDVTLIDAKDYFENVTGALRCMVEPELSAHNLVQYPGSYKPKKGIVVGIATDGQQGQVELQSGEKYPFDYALVATGSAYPGRFIKTDIKKQLTKAERLGEFRAAYSQISSAASVVIVGGGAVGVELAAEIVDAFPGKKITLLTGAASLLERMDETVRKYAADWLQARGVEVIYDERITDWGDLGDGPGPATLATSSRREIQGDWVVKAVGARPDTAALAASLGEDRLAANGAILVEPTLQVKGLQNVFAAGDVTSVEEEKTAFFADLAAMVAARNIERLEKGQKLQPYLDLYGGQGNLPFIGGVTLGKKDGALDMAGDIQTGSSTSTMRRIIKTVILRTAAGSWFWGKVSNFIKGVAVSKLVTAAKKQTVAAPRVVAAC